MKMGLPGMDRRFGDRLSRRAQRAHEVTGSDELRRPEARRDLSEAETPGLRQRADGRYARPGN